MSACCITASFCSVSLCVGLVVCTVASLTRCKVARGAHSQYEMFGLRRGGSQSGTATHYSRTTHARLTHYSLTTHHYIVTTTAAGWVVVKLAHRGVKAVRKKANYFWGHFLGQFHRLISELFQKVNRQFGGRMSAGEFFSGLSRRKM